MTKSLATRRKYLEDIKKSHANKVQAVAKTKMTLATLFAKLLPVRVKGELGEHEAELEGALLASHLQDSS